MAASFPDSQGLGLREIEFPELLFAPSLVAPPALSVDVRLAELRATASRLITVRETLGAAMDPEPPSTT